MYDKLKEGLDQAKAFLGMMDSKGEMKGFPALLNAISLTTADADVKVSLNVTQEMANQIAEDAKKMQSGPSGMPMDSPAHSTDIEPSGAAPTSGSDEDEDSN